MLKNIYAIAAGWRTVRAICDNFQSVLMSNGIQMKNSSRRSIK
jgi:glycerol-3-phosphate dehydrogenase